MYAVLGVWLVVASLEYWIFCCAGDKGGLCFSNGARAGEFHGLVAVERQARLVRVCTHHGCEDGVEKSGEWLISFVVLSFFPFFLLFFLCLPFLYFCFSSFSRPIREGHVAVARMLLEAGADVETPDNYGQTPFFMACWKGLSMPSAVCCYF